MCYKSTENYKILTLLSVDVNQMSLDELATAVKQVIGRSHTAKGANVISEELQTKFVIK